MNHKNYHVLSVILLASMCAALCGCTQETTLNDSVTAQDPVEVNTPDIRVTATERNDGLWRIDYEFAVPQDSVLFSRSNGDYRVNTWTPLDGAAPVERIGGFDAMVFDAPTQAASYLIEPYKEAVPKEYDPYLSFSDGGVAIFTGQFELLPAESREAIEALGGDLGNWQGEQGEMKITIRSGASMLMNGEKYQGEMSYQSRGGGTYVYVGDGTIQEGDSYVGVIDEMLPEHMRLTLDQDLATIYDVYETRWGFTLPERATLYYAFGGYEDPGYSNSGSVLGTLMVIRSKGDNLRDPHPEIRFRNLWFFSHETAHMFQSVSFGQLMSGPHSWIHEGSADAMAYGVLYGLDADASNLVHEGYQKAFDDCHTFLEQGSMATAHFDGRFRAHYVCGQIFTAAMDAALQAHNVYDLWNAAAGRSEAHIGQPDEAFFGAFIDLGGEEQIVNQIRVLLTEELENPELQLTALVESSGLARRSDSGDGDLIFLNLQE